MNNQQLCIPQPIDRTAKEAQLNVRKESYEPELETTPIVRHELGLPYMNLRGKKVTQRILVIPSTPLVWMTWRLRPLVRRSQRINVRETRIRTRHGHRFRGDTWTIAQVYRIIRVILESSLESEILRTLRIPSLSDNETLKTLRLRVFGCLGLWHTSDSEYLRV